MSSRKIMAMIDSKFAMDFQYFYKKINKAADRHFFAIYFIRNPTEAADNPPFTPRPDPP